MRIESEENNTIRKRFEDTSALKKTLDSIDFNDPELSIKLRGAEEEDACFNLQDKKYSFYTSWYLNKFFDIKKNRQIDKLDSLIPRFFLRKTIFSGYRALSEKARITCYSAVNVELLVDHIEAAYIELEKNSRNVSFRRNHLEKALELMKKYPDENNVKFIRKRVEVHLDFGQIEKNPQKKAEHFEQAYKDSLKQIKELKDDSSAALYKLAKVCNYFSNLHVDEKLKKERVKIGINVIEELNERNPGQTTCITDNILGFLYLKNKNSEKGIPLVKRCLEKLNPEILNERTINIYSYAGQAFSEAYKIKSRPKDIEERLDKLEDSDLENLITGIICSELSEGLSEEFSNKEAENYQTIGREYYDLQYLIEKADRGEARGISIKKIKEKIKEILDQKNERGEKIFSKYGGGLLKIVEIENEHKLGEETQFIALERAFEAFDKSNREGDEGSDNKSYRGICIVGLARLNRDLSKIKKEKLEEMLNEAEGLLSEALNERIENKEVDDEDYTRLAGCQFYFADLIDNVNRKKGLYEQTIKNEEEAKRRSQEQNKKIKPEIYSFAASSHYKLAELSESEERRQNLEEAIRLFDDASKGDESAENRSKTGSCHLRLLELKLEEVKHSLWKRGIYEISNLLGIKTKIDKHINQAKEALEEAVEINKDKGGSFVYPYFLLALLAKKVVKTGRELEEYGLKYSNKYLSDALSTYNENTPYWSLNRIGESQNYVFESKDNHGLLQKLIIFKKGKEESLKKEMEITKYYNKKLKGNRKFFTPDPLEIIPPEDKREEMSGTYYVMTRERGDSLEDILKDEKIKREEKFGNLKDVVDYLAFIHAKTPFEIVNQQENYLGKIKDKLNKLKSLVNIKDNVVDVIKNNYSPILKSFEGASLVFNKDAHPENWIIISNKDISAIDFDDKGLDPIEFDLVNLMEYGNYLNNKEKNACIKDYIAAFKKYNNGGLFEVSGLRYLNATIHRAISLVTAWSVLERKSMWPKREVILNNALNAIDRIEEEYNDYYSEHQNEYTKLQEGLIEIHKKL